MDSKVPNPLNNIAANLGVTPKVLTQLAIGDDKEFRELVRGILGMLPENEVILVARDPEINSEFLDYLYRLFESNQKVLLTILQNSSSSKQTKHAILTRLPEEVLNSLLKNPKVSPEIQQILTTPKSPAESTTSSPQSEEFKIKMKVSKLLNDLEANLGLTIDAFMEIRAKDDEQSREFVREVYDALPENDVLLVARDTEISPKILEYLSRLFDSNQKILLTILHNPSSDRQTQHRILDQLSEETVISLAESAKTSPEILRLLGEHFISSGGIMTTIQANPATPSDAKERIRPQTTPETPNAEIVELTEDEEIVELTEDEEIVQLSEEDLVTEAGLLPESSDEDGAYEFEEIDAKITLCVDKLYDINADIVSEFIKKARSEILKRLNLIAKANRLILATIVRHPSLSIEELEDINLEMFASILKKSPEKIDDETVLQLIKQAKRNPRQQ